MEKGRQKGSSGVPRVVWKKERELSSDAERNEPQENRLEEAAVFSVEKNEKVQKTGKQGGNVWEV